jgi:hypothetical protein
VTGYGASTPAVPAEPSRRADRPIAEPTPLTRSGPTSSMVEEEKVEQVNRTAYTTREHARTDVTR